MIEPSSLSYYFAWDCGKLTIVVQFALLNDYVFVLSSYLHKDLSFILLTPYRCLIVNYDRRAVICMLPTITRNLNYISYLV